MRRTFFICIAVSVNDERLIAAPARVPVRGQPISGNRATKRTIKTHSPGEAVLLPVSPAAQRLRRATVKALAQRGASPRQVQVNRPVAEGNCGGEIRPWEATGSELPVRNEEAPRSLSVNSIRWGATGECATIMRNPELKPKLSKERQSEANAATANEPELKKRQ